MSERYKHLTSPLVIRGHALKSRLVHPVAQPHFMQANETYPSDPTISYYETRARNGAALVLLQDCTDLQQRDMPRDVGHFNMYDIDDKGAQNGLSHFVGILHYHGTLVCPELNQGRRMSLSCNDPAWKVPMPRSIPAANSDPSVLINKRGEQIHTAERMGTDMTKGFGAGREFEAKSKSAMIFKSQRYMTREVMDEYIEKTIAHAKKYQELGYDGGYLDLSHNFPIGQFLRTCVNHRTDEYGGSLENRMRFPLEVIRKLRQAMGEDYILCINSPVLDGDSCGDGMTLDELVEFVKLAEPYVDLMQLRRRSPDHAITDRCQSVEYSAYLKSKGIRLPIAVSTPYKDLDKLESIIAEGKADLIAPGHLFICNENLGEILKNGNGEDLNPCIECHICRGNGNNRDWMSHCTINPEMGVEYRLKHMIRPVEQLKRVAIIGGGPGGMKCAMYLKDRGHTPVIFEKTDELGGQIKTAKYPDFKWELLRYLNFLKAQVAKRGIEVRLNTEATPEGIRAEGFDVVIAATGAEPKLPRVPGVEHVKWNIINVYENEEKIGKRVVVVGGSSTAAEAASFLAKKGHEVIELTRGYCLGHDLNPIRSMPYMNILANTAGVDVVYEAAAVKFEEGGVWYRDTQGEEHYLPCDDIVAAGGMSPNMEAAIAFHNCAREFYMIGDCRHPGSMKEAIRDAFGIAMQI